MDRGRTMDRASELAILLLAGAIAWQLASSSGGGARSAPLAPGGPDPAVLAGEVDRARVLVDGKDPAAPAVLSSLLARAPESAEAWALAARRHEDAGASPEAVRAWARAVSLEGGYLDRRSPLYRGGLIGPLVKRELARLRGEKASRDLTPAEKEELTAAYFLLRALAGGCE